MKSSNKTIFYPLWNLLRSVKLTILLLIILAASSIIGTVIPQRGQGAMEFARELSPEAFRLLSNLGLFDMYHSLWFRLILVSLVLNLIVCSIDRFPSSWRLFKTSPNPDRKAPFKDIPPEQSFVVNSNEVKETDIVKSLIKARFRKFQDIKRDGDYVISAEKGRYSYFGVYLVHLSVLAILLGGMAGSFFGFEAYVNILEGTQVDTVTLKKERSPLKLGFKVGCEKFHVDFYENGAPKEYRAELRFITGKNEIEDRIVRVNHPVKFGGVTFYQASYGKVPSGKVVLSILNSESRQEILQINTEMTKTNLLPQKEGSFQVVDIRTDFMHTGPAALISITPDKGVKTKFWIFHSPEKIKEALPSPMLLSKRFDASAFAPYTFVLKSVESKYYTGLQANKDPGVPVVWAGCVIMLAGFFITYFTSHRRIWVSVKRDDTGALIRVAGKSNKNPVGLGREITQFTKNLKENLDAKEHRQ